MCCLHVCLPVLHPSTVYVSHAMQCNAMQCNAMRCNAMRCTSRSSAALRWIRSFAPGPLLEPSCSCSSSLLRGSFSPPLAALRACHSPSTSSDRGHKSDRIRFLHVTCAHHIMMRVATSAQRSVGRRVAGCWYAPPFMHMPPSAPPARAQRAQAQYSTTAPVSVHDTFNPSLSISLRAPAWAAAIAASHANAPPSCTMPHFFFVVPVPLSTAAALHCHLGGWDIHR